MSRETFILLQDIERELNDVESFVAGVTREDFFANVMLHKAVLRSLEVAGEAVECLPAELRDKYPDVPWRRMAGLRDILIHRYSGLDPDAIWATITVSVPDLLPRIREIVELESSRDVV